MPRFPFPFPWTRIAFGALASASTVAAAMAGCSDDAPQVPTASAPAPHEAPAAAIIEPSRAAREHLAALRARFPDLLTRGPFTRFERTPSGGVRPAAPSRAAAGSAAVELPARASGAARIVDGPSGLAVTFTLEGAGEAEAENAEGLVLYEGGGPGGADLVHRAHGGGTEDLVHFEARPAREALRYRLGLDEGAKGLRLVAGTLEILDARGVPRLRIAPPWLVDAEGAHRSAALGVEGCAVDADPRAPWERPVTPAGAASCSVVVDWSRAGARYPVLVDPSWQSTGNMSAPRARPALAEIGRDAPLANLVLVTGGFDAVGNALASAELYYPLDRVFAATGAMTTPRGAHTATSLRSDLKGKVLVAGGSSAKTNGAARRSTEVYDPGSGTFLASADMLLYRFDHAAVRLEDGKVLLTGGAATPDLAVPVQPSRKAEIDTVDLMSGSGTIAAAPDMTTQRAGHAAVLVGGDVLVTGGFTNAGFASLSAELYCSATSANPKWCNGKAGQFVVGAGLSMGAPRAFHAATRLLDGRVLVTGGVNAVAPPYTYADTADVFVPDQGFLPSALKMKSRRAFHTATLLTTGEVVVAGGFGGPAGLPTADIQSAETFSPAKPPDQAFTQLGGTMKAPRKEHAAILVAAGGSNLVGKTVLLVGGDNDANPALASAEILLKDIGEDCARDDECLSGYCTGQDGTPGICCNAECGELCVACRQAQKEPAPGGGMATPDGMCGFAKSGTGLGWNCVPDEKTSIPVEFFLVCDGKGGTKPTTGTTCGPNGCDPSTNRCSDQCPCSDAGFCTDAAPDAAPADPDAAAPSAEYCELRRNNGQACGEGRECNTGYCVDGVCCNSPCAEQCQACDIPGFVGTCSTVGTEGAEPPHGIGVLRQACNGTGTACEGACNGVSFTKCTYPGADKPAKPPACACDDEECTKAASERTYVCDGAGGVTESKKDCAGFQCTAAGNCKTSCASDDDCLEDFFCEGGKCAALPAEGRCDGDHTVRVPGFKDIDCTPFECQGSACRKDCQSIDDCVAPSVCNLDNQCGAPPPPPATPGCSASGTGSDAPSARFALLAALAALAAARRRRR